MASQTRVSQAPRAGPVQSGLGCGPALLAPIQVWNRAPRGGKASGSVFRTHCGSSLPSSRKLSRNPLPETKSTCAQNILSSPHGPAQPQHRTPIPFRTLPWLPAQACAHRGLNQGTDGDRAEDTAASHTASSCRARAPSPKPHYTHARTHTQEVLLGLAPWGQGQQTWTLCGATGGPLPPKGRCSCM